VQKLYDRFLAGIIEHPRLVLACIAVCFLAALSSLPLVRFDNSVDVFFNKKSKSYIDFENWKRQFGSDQVVIIAFSDDDIFTYQNLSLIANLTEELEAVENVRKVTSLTNVNDIVGDKEDFIVKPFIEEIPRQKQALGRLRQSALANPLYLDAIISKDGTATAVMVELENRATDDDAYKKEALEAIATVAKKTFGPDRKHYISGLAAIEHYYAAYMQDDIKRSVPLILVMIILILVISFRNLVEVSLTLASVVTSLVATVSLFYLLGYSVNNVTTIIPPTILAIAVADSIHVAAEGLRSQATVRELMGRLLLPCLLTTLTTVAGFLSLTVSDVLPIRQLGLIAALGVLLAFAITFTLLPVLLSLYRRGAFTKATPSAATAAGGSKVFINALSDFVKNRKSAIILITAILAVLSMAAASRIRAETSVIEYFRRDSPIYQATRFIEEKISGVHFLNISLQAGEDDFFREPQALSYIAELEAFSSGISAVDDAVSAADYVKEINKSFHNEDEAFYTIPASRNLIAQYLLLYGATDLNDYIDSRWQWATIRLRLKEHSTACLAKIIDTIRSYLREHPFAGVTAEVLGQTVLEVETNEAVTRGQVQSLAIAFIVIFAMMFMMFRDVRLGTASIISNLLPLLVMFGIMGACGIRLNSATSMIAAVGIGIIVDDTIHFLYSFKEAYAGGASAEASVRLALHEKTRPIILTSIILFFGFIVLIVSRFTPTFYFGLLSATLMASALAADLVVLPAVLLCMYRKR